ncbi:MAG: retropepsin-like aspartic protease [Candidatus Omnitrophota bacterium]
MTVSCIVGNAGADTVYFENGGSIEGIVTKEDEHNVEISVGFGTVTCGRTQIRKIERSSPEEAGRMQEEWTEKRKEMEKQEKEFREARERRFDEYEKWVKEERERKRYREEFGVREIEITQDITSRSILVDTVLNGKTGARLVLDTGASIVVLSNDMARRLGVDLSDRTKGMVELRLAGNRRIRAKMIILESVMVQHIEEKKVMAAILTEDTPDTGFGDGLLGMSFLNRFNLRIDLKNMKIFLEKLKREQA